MIKSNREQIISALFVFVFTLSIFYDKIKAYEKKVTKNESTLSGQNQTSEH